MKLTIQELRVRAKQPRETLSDEQAAFRVDLVCSCNNDIAYGYGESVDYARQLARYCLVRDHGRAVRVRVEIVQKAVRTLSGGWRYEEMTADELKAAS